MRCVCRLPRSDIAGEIIALSEKFEKWIWEGVAIFKENQKRIEITEKESDSKNEMVTAVNDLGLANRNWNRKVGGD